MNTTLKSRFKVKQEIQNKSPLQQAVFNHTIGIIFFF